VADDQTARSRLARLRASLDPFMHFATDSTYARSEESDRVADFVFGNPHELASRAYGDALARATVPRTPDHYAYKLNERVATEAVATSLAERFGIPFSPEDIYMTNGNFAGISIVLRTVVEPGDEVVFVSPPWFFYEGLILAAGAEPVRVSADRRTWDLDLDALERAITPRTRAVLINSPNNPTGKVYPPATLDRLSAILTAASRGAGRPVLLLSDEAYSRILFDDRPFSTPVAHYPHSFLLYTYGKAHLAPGSRLGYIAVPPTMPERHEMRDSMLLWQVLTGWAFPVALLQHALPNLDPLGIDIGSLQRRRDRMVPALREMGYEVVLPEATFYVLVRSPWEDDMDFAELLASRDVFVLPGQMFEMPGWFRISLTASDEMVERGIPGFAAGMDAARGDPRAVGV
jgi:aspartate aminotransferase